MTLAYGAELRFEDYETSAGDPASYLPGPEFADVGAQAGPGLPADSEADVDRDVVSVYLDLEANVTERLRLGAAARYEDYDDFGDALTGKASAFLQVSDVFALRAAAGTSFRAPSLAQIGYERSTTNFGSGGQLELFRLLPVSDPDAIANGAVSLDEEESQHLSIGAIVDLGEVFSLTVDYFRIDVDDRISLVNAGNNVQYFANRVDTETDGFDLVAEGTLPLGDGTFDWQLAYNTAETDVDNPAAVGVEDLNTLEGAAPEDKFIASAGWRGGRWSALVRATRFGEATRVFDFGGGFEPRQTYGSVWSLDLEVGVDVSSGWHVAVGADNALDEYPDESSSDINFFGHLPYDVLSPIGMNGRYWYVRTELAF